MRTLNVLCGGVFPKLFVLCALLSGCFRGSYETRVSVRDPKLVQITSLRDGAVMNIDPKEGLVDTATDLRSARESLRRVGDDVEWSWTVTIVPAHWQRSEREISSNLFTGERTVEVTQRRVAGEYNHFRSRTPAANVGKVTIQQVGFRKDGLKFIAAGLLMVAVGYLGTTSDHFFLKYPGYFVIACGAPLAVIGGINTFRFGHSESLPIPPAATALPP
jgi:hypothetical protein